MPKRLVASITFEKFKPKSLSSFTYDFLHEEIMKAVHNDCSHHKKILKSNKRCGCFHCVEYFKTADIKEWIDKNQTALCPLCGIDAVLPYKSKSCTLNKLLLKQMNKFWFKEKTVINKGKPVPQ